MVGNCALEAIETLDSANSVDRFDYPRLGPPWPENKAPSWIEEEGLVFVGNWEPLVWEYRKNWQNWANAGSESLTEEIHRTDRSEEAVSHLHDMGVNMVLGSFHKGFGIENERETMKEAESFAKLLHRYDMRMGVLVSTLLLYEDLYGEFPESRDWHRILYDGLPDVYANDGFRYRAYLNHPEFIGYMKRVCELAVDAGADAIFFDTVRQLSENHHPLAQEMFRDFLRSKYPDGETWYFRTGLHYRDYVKIPHLSPREDHLQNALRMDAFDQAILQEYQDFKSQQLADFAAEMCTFIHLLNPDVAVWFNTGGITGKNVVSIHNMDHARVLPWLNLYYSEEKDYASYNEHGGIVSKIRTIKAGQTFGAVHTNAAGQPPPSPSRSLHHGWDDPRLRLAEAMAFNRLALGNIGYGASHVIDHFPDEGRKYLRFYRSHFDLFRGCQTVADVAVLRTFASLAYNNYTAHQDTILAEQALIQDQIPFDLVFDDGLTDLSKYKVIVLGNQESLSDEQVGVLDEYVRKGGGLVATRNTSIFDEWRRQRQSFGLADVLGLNWPPAGYEGEGNRSKYGQGRAAYLPQLVSSVPIQPRTEFTLEYWAPPDNSDEFLKDLRWVARGGIDWEIKAPEHVAAEVYYQAESDRYIIHLVNYNCWKVPVVENISVQINGKEASGYRKATFYSPDAKESNVLSFDQGILTLETLNIYGIITLEK